MVAIGMAGKVDVPRLMDEHRNEPFAPSPLERTGETSMLGYDPFRSGGPPMGSTGESGEEMGP